VTTETFLAAFGMESLRDLPDREQLLDSGVVGEASQVDFG
jgi:chromosome segregation and condensation protein ScpB